jgi:PKD repeat protein
MNPYLIEPYNAYTHGKKRKKHWTELMEEEALYHKMIQDQLRLQETKEQTAQQQTTAQAAAAAGAGGVAPYEYYNPGTKVINFSATPLYGDAPLTVQFTNLTTNPGDDEFVWYFGDGETSTLAQPGSHTYNLTGSVITATGTGSYTVILSASQASLGQAGHTIKTGYISASNPSIGSLGIVPNRYETDVNSPITWTNTISGANRVAVAWGDGIASTASYSGSYSVAVNSLTHSYISQSGYTASFTAFNTIYGTLGTTSSRITINQPVTAAFTSSNTVGNAPLAVTFSNQSSYGAAYRWEFGSGSLISVLPGLTGTAVTCSYATPGQYTVQLQVTGTFGSASAKTSASMVYAQHPIVVAAFTSSGALRGNVPLPVTFSNQSVNGVSYLWTFGTGSLTSTVAGLTGTGVTCSYTSANEGAALYTVSLAVSGTFGSGSLFTSASMISASRA